MKKIAFTVLCSIVTFLEATLKESPKKRSERSAASRNEEKFIREQRAQALDSSKKRKKEQENSQESVKKAKGVEVNKIMVLIYMTPPSAPGSDKELERVPDIVITKLDLERPTIEGRLRTLEELIFDKLLYFEATYLYRITLSDEIIDKYILSIKEGNNISDEQLRMMFKQVGYTYEEAREQLGMNQAVQAILDFKIKSRLVVPESDVRAFYDEHPEYEEASYRIKKAYIPNGILTEEEVADLTTVSERKMNNLDWSIAYWLADDEVTEERRNLLRNISVGGYSRPEEVTGGYELITLLESRPRRLKPFEERYRTIVSYLQEPQFYKMLDEFKKELLAKYEIVYLE